MFTKTFAQKPESLAPKKCAGSETALRRDTLGSPEGRTTMDDSNRKSLHNWSILLKAKTQFYRDEARGLELMFSNLRLVDDKLNIYKDCSDLLDKLYRTEQKPVDGEKVLVHRLRKHGSHKARLKACSKMYIDLNAKLSDSIKTVKSESELLRTRVDCLVGATRQELMVMEDKIRRYENELVKFEKKYPWLKEAGLDLSTISKQIKELDSLRLQKDRLTKELSQYRGLKPDLDEAAKQLAQVKIEHQEISNKLLMGRK